MNRLILILIVGFSTLFAPELQAAEILDGIKGRDDRLVMPSGEYPWRAVGRVNTETGGHCTGVLVGPSLAVTAAHCLYDKRKMWYVPAPQVHFVAGFRNGKYAAHTTAKNYIIPNGYDEQAKPSRRMAFHDWAFIQLNEAIGYQTGWIGVRDAFQGKGLDESFVQAGYSKDSKTVLSAHIGCPILRRDVDQFADGKKRALLVHRCDAVPGDSGSPIFYYHEGKPYLAAIHVATTKELRPVQGIAVPVSTFERGIVQLGGGEPAFPEGEEAQISHTVEILLRRLGIPDESTFFAGQGLETPDRVGYDIIGQLISAMTKK
ncbi:MAG: trypsin-like serine protease [Rhodospirillales bacterium]|jgi:protease YdgD|nr:trypsin-like serine protease [Rhodospirillales bacterium]